MDNVDDDLLLTASIETSGDVPLDTADLGQFSIFYDVQGLNNIALGATSSGWLCYQ